MKGSGEGDGDIITISLPKKRLSSPGGFRSVEFETFFQLAFLFALVVEKEKKGYPGKRGKVTEHRNPEAGKRKER